MNISHVLQDLIKRGAKLWTEEEQLRCQGPGEVLTPEVLAILKQHKNEFLDLLRENTSKHDEYPLSHGQQALWFLNQDAKESAAYNTAASLRICSPLNVAAMKSTFQYLVDRHPMLRAYFPVHEGKPLQKIRENQNVNFKIVDASDVSEEQLRQQVVQTYQQPFDLETGPLLRIHLFRRTEEDHLLLITVHHIVFDAWSGWLFMDEFSKAYSSITAGKTPSLAPLQHNYQNYIQWQTDMLAGPEGEKLWQYWQKKLAGEIPVLQLATDRPRPPVQTFHGATIGFSIDETLTRQLRELARIEGTTLFTVLMAAFNVLLHRYTGQDDIIVGSPTVGRDNRDFTGIAGYFVNPVVIRTDCADKPTFRSFLRQVSDTVLEAIEHQDFPFPLLVERLQPTRSSGFSPLFQVDFALQRAQVGDFTNLLDVNEETAVTMNWGGLEVKPFVIPQQEGQFDLTLEIFELENSLAGYLKYNVDLFDEDTIKCMAGHFDVLVRGIVQNPTQRVTLLPLLPQEEQLQLQAWNLTDTVYPKDKTIVDLFQEQVEKTPDNIAVVFEDQQLTYQELNRKANQLAHYLLNLKTDTDNSPLISGNCLVGICMERSLDMVIGLLGILKAGGAYVPLDPEYPEHRLQFMLEDSQVSVLLSQSNLLDRLPDVGASLRGCPRLKVLCLDSDWVNIANCSAEDPTRQSKPEHLAYVIYTSGSTGVPKGTLLTHKSLSNYLYWALNEYNPAQGVGVPVQSSIGFDATITSLYLPIISGTRAILIPEKQELNNLAEILRYSNRLGLIKITPAHLEVLNQQLEKTEFAQSAYALIIGGEALTTSQIQPWLTHAPQVRLINEYGPTESVVGCCIYDAMGQTDLPGNVPIGRPIANTKIYILDSNLNPTPKGIPGELCIAGAGLARGYLNRPDLTAEKFIEVELFGKSERLYKTGDIARWLPDGNLEYLGRLDNQIKLRGFRIELGEIESTLSQHQVIREAVVVYYDKEDNPRLVAYVTLVMPIDDVAGVLREWLKERLPEYMVPVSFTVLDTMPLTPNGKIDRKLLPAPDSLIFADSYEAARTDSEQRLVEVWGSVLKQSGIGIHDNFFELGGDSILSIQIVARAREAGLGLSSRDVFQYQTIAELAHVVQPVKIFMAEQGLVSGEVPLIPIQKFFFAGHTSEPWHFNQAILLSVPDGVSEAALRKALEAVLQHHDVLRMRYRHKNGKWHQNHTAPGDGPPFHREDLNHVQEEQQAQELSKRADFWQSSLDLEKGPLMRLVLFKMGKESRLLWCIHHLVVDGVSWRILLEDLHTAYQQAIVDKSIKLPAKTSAFKVWAERLCKWKDTESFIVEAEHWRTLPVSTPLPMDNPTCSNCVADTQHYTISFTAEITQKLLKEAPAAYRTQINDLLLTALLLSLHDWTRQQHHLIDLESHGRADLFDDIDLSRTVGWFTSIHTISLGLPAGGDLGETLKSIKEQLRKVPHEGVGYGVLRYLCGETLPRGKILFNYLGQFDQSVQDTDWDFAAEESGQAYSLQGEREHIIEINGQAIKGCLNLTWSYSREQYREKTIRSLADNYRKYLHLLIDNCSKHIGYTPTDFPLATLNQARIDNFVQSYGKNIADLYPLSPMQQGMLFHTLYAPESGVYFEQLHFCIEGDMKPDVFRQAWQRLIDRHAILRTAFLHEGDKPLQLVCSKVQVPWEYFDWHELSPEEQQEQLETLLHNEREQGFKLSRAPLMRMHLIRETESRHRFVWNLHHLLMDGWCLSILFTELMDTYHAYAQGQTPVLPPVRPYRDYITWLSKQDQKDAKRYWQEQLQGFITPTPLPIGQYSHSQARYREVSITLDSHLSQQLDKFSREHRLTLSTLVQGAWAALLMRYSGESDVVFGVTTSGRNVPIGGVDRMVGLFINTMPLRIKEEGEDLIAWLQAIQERQQQNNPYAYTSLVDIQDWSDVPNGVALFESLIVFENYPMDEKLRQPGVQSLKITDFQVIEYTNYPLTLAVIPKQQLHFKLTYDSNRFSEESMERMVAHVSNLLEGIVTNPGYTISQLPLLTETETQLLQAWNETEVEYPTDKTIVDLFQEQVEKTPDNIAVVFEGQKFTYQELNGKANQLAHYLFSLKTETDNCLVGICMDRSLEMVIGLLGILKAGGAYVPLDPEYPEHRLQYMLEDSKVEMLLTQSHFLEQLPAGQAKVVCIDSEWGNITHYSDKNPTRKSGPESMAYVIYTSGSTGLPKGVMIRHNSLTNLIYWHNQQFNVTQLDKATLLAGMAFDASCWELWPYLSVGACVYPVKAETVASSGVTLKEWFDEKQITMTFLPTPLLESFLTEIWQNKTLRRILTGGDTLHTYLPSECHFDLYNNYGPTENTVVTTSGKVPHKEVAHLDNQEFPSIGKPIANTQIYILDINQKPTPIGIPGELCIAGIRLARGYLNRPDLTAEKFIEVELFGKSERIYKTGDMVRWLPDGNLEFLGRLDNQIKLRGFRIELGEIESTLSQHEVVQQSVVVLQGNDGEKRMIAYITMNDGQLRVNRSEVLLTDNRTLITELRSWLKTRLPEYMVPSGFTVLDTMPLTQNGKIDRKKLETIDIGYRGPEESYVAPRTPDEELLSVIWANVLSFERVGIHDNFFELGGHSLLATKLVSRIRESFGVEMPLPIVFEHPILQDQAAWLDHQQHPNELPPIVPLSDGEPIVLSFAQQRLWFLAQMEGQSATYNMPAALYLKGELDHAALERSMETLIKRHDSLRLCFPVVDGEATVKLLDVYNPFTFTDLSGLSDDEQQHQREVLIENHAQTHFDITTGPLLRLHLIKLSDKEHILLFNMHHIISDGWSIGVLIREWRALYSAYYRDEDAELPKLSIQYTDYSVWQRAWLSGEVLEQQLTYWQEKLSGAPELLELPTDFQRPAVMSYRGDHLQSKVSVGLTERLKHLSRERGVTLYMTLLTTFNILLYRYSGQKDILVGTPIANRTHYKTEDLIGFFVNTLVLRTRIKPAHPITELLEQIRQTALEAYAHQDIPFEYLIEQLNPTRSLSHSPLFQAMFVLQNAPMGTLDLEGLEVSLLEQKNTTTKFDITLSIEEQGDELVCDWEYCTDLFHQKTIERMIEHFKILLDGVVNNPEQSVSQLPLLTETEIQQLQSWNQTETDYQKDKTIVDLFQEQVEKNPENIAVVFEDQQLNYQELNTKANQLAHYLMTLGVGAETLVGICVERSLEMVIGLLGILKAGGAYVPLDPDYPLSRLQFILEDSEVVVLLSQSNLLDRLPVVGAYFRGCPGPNVQCLDSEWEQIAGCSGENPVRQSGPENLAYVIYTSGSTGKPKGCKVIQSNVTRLFATTEGLYNFNQRDIWTLFHSYAFDFSVWEIWGALFYGAKLVVVPYLTSRNPEAFYQLLLEQGVTVLNQTPSAFKQLIEVDNRSGELSLRFVIFGGEALDFAALQPWFARHGDRRPQLVNMYGITETTVHVTYYPLTCDQNNDKSIIGSSLPDLQIWVVDAHHQPVPIGVSGEMYVGGAGVTRGYHNRPELTAEKFIEIEIFGKPQRLYKSGDLARWLPDGTLEYLGRIDNQVKIRGFRIELGEIEACLVSNPTVKEAVVMVSGQDETKTLIAYITANTKLKVEELRYYIKTLLPDYMVPSYFVQLDALPLLPNGKTDRKVLTGLKPLESTREYRPPQNDLESELLSIWKKYIKTERLSTNINFFEAGGNSLSLVRVRWEIEKKFPEVTLMDLFANPNIEDLALFLSRKKNGTTLIMESLPLDKRYFSAERESGVLEYKLDQGLVIRLREYGNKENLDIQDILRTTFGYLLLEISNQNMIQYYVTLNEKQIISIRHNYDDINSIKELLQESHVQFLNPVQIYSAEDFMKTGTNPGTCQVLPLYSNPINGEFENTDLHFQTDTKNDTVEMAFSFSSRMDKEEMRKLPGLYVAILEEMVKGARE